MELAKQAVHSSQGTHTCLLEVMQALAYFYDNPYPLHTQSGCDMGPKGAFMGAARLQPLSEASSFRHLQRNPDGGGSPTITSGSCSKTSPPPRALLLPGRGEQASLGNSLRSRGRRAPGLWHLPKSSCRTCRPRRRTENFLGVGMCACTGLHGRLYAQGQQSEHCVPGIMRVKT